MDIFRPIFWFTNEDKAEYKEWRQLRNSDCYEVWGLTRTGCAGCSFARDFNGENALAAIYEPNFSKAAMSIFKDAYEYANRYNEYKAMRKQEEKEQKRINKEKAKNDKE